MKSGKDHNHIKLIIYKLEVIHEYACSWVAWGNLCSHSVHIQFSVCVCGAWGGTINGSV